MLSRLKKGFLYTDVSPDITENDLDVVADTWEMDGREVYRGTRDPRYTHANVFWLYDDSLERVGCVEHDYEDHANMRVLWFYDSEFGTLLQEDGWEVTEDIWSRLPRHVFDRFLNEGWTTPKSFLEHCLQGPVRVVTPDMITALPVVLTCTQCDAKTLDRHIPGCTMIGIPMDFPQKEKVFFVDSDFVIHVPPRSSSVWSYLGLRQPLQPDDDSSRLLQELVQEPKDYRQTEQRPPPAQHHSPH